MFIYFFVIKVYTCRSELSTMDKKVELQKKISKLRREIAIIRNFRKYLDLRYKKRKEAGLV